MLLAYQLTGYVLLLRVPCLPYEEEHVASIHLSDMCGWDEDLYRMRCPLICFYAVEYNLPHRFARQFGMKQLWPVEPFSTSVELHK